MCSNILDMFLEPWTNFFIQVVGLKSLGLVYGEILLGFDLCVIVRMICNGVIVREL